MYLKFQIKVPKIIESIIVYFLLRYRKKHYGLVFRRIKLAKSEHVDVKHQYAVVDPEDYQRISQDDWQLYDNHNYNFYALRIDDGKIVSMHRQIMVLLKAKSLTIETAKDSITEKAICVWQHALKITATENKYRAVRNTEASAMINAERNGEHI